MDWTDDESDVNLILSRPLFFFVTPLPRLLSSSSYHDPGLSLVSSVHFQRSLFPQEPRIKYISMRDCKNTERVVLDAGCAQNIVL